MDPGWRKEPRVLVGGVQISQGKGNLGIVSRSVAKYSQYRAFCRYSQPYSVGGSSGSDFRCNLLIFCFFVCVTYVCRRRQILVDRSS